jgi:uncharacterized UBP type Zn finger protein
MIPRFKGINNNCYINAVVQSLLNINCIHINIPLNGIINLTRYKHSLASLDDNYSEKIFLNNDQQDARDALSRILEHIKNISVIYFKLESKCKLCNDVTYDENYRTQDAIIMDCEPPNPPILIQDHINKFKYSCTEVETTCEKCKNNSFKDIVSIVSEYPKVLLLFVNKGTQENCKIYFDTNNVTLENREYKLNSVIFYHQMSSRSDRICGHYTAGIIKKGKMFYIDDEIITDNVHFDIFSKAQVFLYKLVE